jgi:hypothetical protein
MVVVMGSLFSPPSQLNENKKETASCKVDTEGGDEDSHYFDRSSY